MHVENKRLELPADVAVERLLHDGVRDLGGGVARGMLRLEPQVDDDFFKNQHLSILYIYVTVR